MVLFTHPCLEKKCFLLISDYKGSHLITKNSPTCYKCLKMEGMHST